MEPINYPLIKQLLYSQDESETAQGYQILSQLEKISDYFLDDIFNNPDRNKLIPTLKHCQRISRRQLFRFSNYVKQHINNMELHILIDTIDYIYEIQIDGFQDECLELVKTPSTNTKIAILSASYVFENNIFSKLADLKPDFHNIIYNDAYAIETRVLSSFLLYRYTGIQEYLDFLAHQLYHGSQDLKNLIRSKLDQPFYAQEIFAQHGHIRSMV